MKTGLVSISFRGLSPREIIALSQDCALEAIEWGGDVHVPCGDLDRASQVGAMTRDAGLAVACYGSYCRLTKEEAAAGALEKTVETARTLGAPLIRVWAGRQGSGQATPQERAEIAENAQRMAALAQAAGMEIAFEYHGGTLTDDAFSALSLLQAVNRENVGTLWQPPVDMDTAGCLAGIETVGSYIRNVHVFSWLGTERLPLAAGAEKWRACLRALQALPGKRALLLEFVQGDAPAQLKRDAACLRQWLQEL